VISAKTFKPVDFYCVKQCFREVDKASQENFFNEFWSSGDYNIQNIILKGLMTLKHYKVRYLSIFLSSLSLDTIFLSS